ncbi:MAG: hypothetical protein FJ087_01175 [Deltaproteobacteria bacterium]|nr:hypothetical protein [Deltaproteobacteria bacterium]
MKDAIAQGHSILHAREKCVGCVTCTQACPTKALRVRGGRLTLKQDLCIDCGECIRCCRHGANSAPDASTSDSSRFRLRVALPSTTLFTQFGRDVRPAQVLDALTRIGFDAWYDMSWMCEMVARAVDTWLSECSGPWPKISVTCPAIVRLILIRYPDLLPHLVPIEAPRELAAKLVRRRLASERGLSPGEIGIFYLSPCSALMQSIAAPVGLPESHIDVALSIAGIYGRLLKAIKAGAREEHEPRSCAAGLQWAAGGGECAMMRNRNTMAVSGVADVTRVFDRIESGIYQGVDYIEAYLCPDGCVSGPLLIEGRYAARRTLRLLIENAGIESTVKEEKVRTLFREHFFDLEQDVRARPVRPRTTDLRQAVRLKQEKSAVLAKLPKKDCGACGAPDCETHAEDVAAGDARIDDCVFVHIETLESGVARRGDPSCRATQGGKVP